MAQQHSYHSNKVHLTYGDILTLFEKAKVLKRYWGQLKAVRFQENLMNDGTFLSGSTNHSLQWENRQIAHYYYYYYISN